MNDETRRTVHRLLHMQARVAELQARELPRMPADHDGERESNLERARNAESAARTFRALQNEVTK